LSPLDDEFVRLELQRAWQESDPATTESHEEGGFILQHPDGRQVVERWPRGAQNEINVPPHPGGRRGGLLIVATFHTHPNPGSDFQQEPSLTDIRAVRDDPDLSHPEYEGEFVIADEHIYLVSRYGEVTVVGLRRSILNTF
jgi:hypothetical protein